MQRACRTPWGLRHILAILALTAVGWLVIIVLVRTFARQAVFGPGGAPSIGGALVLTALLYAVLYLVIVVVVRAVHGWKALGYRAPSGGALLGVLAILPLWYLLLGAAFVASSLVINHGQPIPSNVSQLFPGGLKGVSHGDIALAFVVAAVIAPLVVETFFRGVLYQWLRGHIGVAPAVAVSAFLFGGAHLIWLLLPVLFVMGCVLAVVFQRARSLFASMLLHGINNAVAIAVLLAGLSH
jgi:membrane protease YdiL (CAAX protease family)